MVCGSQKIESWVGEAGVEVLNGCLSSQSRPLAPLGHQLVVVPLGTLLLARALVMPGQLSKAGLPTQG
eukprot:3732088-Amphidinium_carterae.1